MLLGRFDGDVKGDRGTCDCEEENELGALNLKELGTEVKKMNINVP